MKPALYGLDLEEARALAGALGESPYRGGQLLKWLYRSRITTLDEAQNLPAGFRKVLSERCDLSSLHLSERQASPEGESVKYLFATRDRHLLETVLIKTKPRLTVCVSTQLGCKMGCVFCASSRGGFVRNLTAGEIIEQIVSVERDLNGPVTNIVFMGMGEPLDNFEATMKALKILQADWGFKFGSRRITVSTSGMIPAMIEFVRRSEGRVRLSVSLHSSSDSKRTQLMPVNKRYPVKELETTLDAIRRKLKREITFEYTLIEGVNDSVQDAQGLAKLAKRLEAKVNLIPCNPIREASFNKPADSVILEFTRVLEGMGVRVMLRRTEGRDIQAACGQLRLDRISDGDTQTPSAEPRNSQRP